MTVTDTDLTSVEEEIAEALRNTHIVNPPDNKHITQGRDMTAGEIVAHARAALLEVVALCGYRWVPINNPEKYPLCEECSRIAHEYIREDEG